MSTPAVELAIELITHSSIFLEKLSKKEPFSPATQNALREAIDRLEKALTQGMVEDLIQELEKS